MSALIAHKCASPDDARGACRGQVTWKIVEEVRRPLAQTDRGDEPPEPRP